MQGEIRLINRVVLARHYRQPLSEINALDPMEIDVLQRWMGIELAPSKSKARGRT